METSEADAEPKRPGKFADILFRVIASSLVALFVLSVSIYSAWRQGRGSDLISGEQLFTWSELRMIDDAITDYRKQNGSLPSTLAELHVGSSRGIRDDDANSPLDGWKRRYHYETNGTNWVVTSYGRDGVTGGVGFDADLTSKNRRSPETRPTFRQFLFEAPRANGMINSCLVCAAIAFFVGLTTVRTPEFSQRSLARLAVRVIATAIATALIACAISALHVPSGH